MRAINTGEYGEPILIDLTEDVSGNTNKMVIKDPSGNETTKTATVGATTKTDEHIGQVTANEYIEYTIEDGLIDESGRWMVRATSEGNGKLRKTDWLPLVVRK